MEQGSQGVVVLIYVVICKCSRGTQLQMATFDWLNRGVTGLVWTSRHANMRSTGRADIQVYKGVRHHSSICKAAYVPEFIELSQLELNGSVPWLEMKRGVKEFCVYYIAN